MLFLDGRMLRRARFMSFYPFRNLPPRGACRLPEAPVARDGCMGSILGQISAQSKARLRRAFTAGKHFGSGLAQGSLWPPKTALGLYTFWGFAQFAISLARFGPFVAALAFARVPAGSRSRRHIAADPASARPRGAAVELGPDPARLAVGARDRRIEGRGEQERTANPNNGHPREPHDLMALEGGWKPKCNQNAVLRTR